MGYLSIYRPIYSQGEINKKKSKPAAGLISDIPFLVLFLTWYWYMFHQARVKYFKFSKVYKLSHTRFLLLALSILVVLLFLSPR